METLPENKLLGELNKTVQYSKQKVGAKILELQRDNKIDLSLNDAAALSSALNLVLEQVYKDIAPSFSSLKEAIRESRKSKK